MVYREDMDGKLYERRKARDGSPGGSSIRKNHTRPGQGVSKEPGYPDGCPTCKTYIAETQKTYWASFKPALRRARQSGSHILTHHETLSYRQELLPGIQEL